METNESILTRSVVGLDDRKVLGKVNDLRVDCDTLAVSHYIVGNPSTNAPLALPFASSLSVGDTFLTIQSRDEFIAASSSEAKAVVRNGFSLVGVDVCSSTGNKLGKVKSYEFNPVFGTVERILLDGGAAFSADTFVFFAPEFVFVNDGGKTAGELRAAKDGNATPEDMDDKQKAAKADDKPAAKTSKKVAGDEKASKADAPADKEADKDADLVKFLLGATLAEGVKSADGAFSANKGTKLTQKLIDEASEHDALLLLTLSVEE